MEIDHLYKDYLIRSEYETWEILFYKYLNADINLSFFEKELDSNPIYESQIGSDIFVELMSLNFNSKYSNIEISSFIRRNITEKAPFIEWQLYNLLIKAGYVFKKEQLTAIAENRNLPVWLLNEYGGLDIGRDYAKGILLAECNLLFAQKPERERFLEKYEKKTGNLYFVASDEEGDFCVYMNEEALFFEYIGMAQEMYVLGKFKEMLRHRLLNIESSNHEKISLI